MCVFVIFPYILHCTCYLLANKRYILLCRRQSYRSSGRLLRRFDCAALFVPIQSV